MADPPRASRPSVRVLFGLAPGSADETTVADVARRWGFHHMGRFSNEFLQRSGEYPKNTLRRR